MCGDGIHTRMTETVTITHHVAKPEYKWEIVIPEGPTILLPEDKLSAAMELLGLDGDAEVHTQVNALPNGGSRSVNVELRKAALEELVSLGVKTV